MLLVEDDAAVRKTVHTVLALAGYVVHEAANATDAVTSLAPRGSRWACS